MNERYYNAAELKKELDGYVMGQEQGVRCVAMAVSSHLLRIREHRKDKNSCIRKDNMLLEGPSGSGKTETFRVLQRLEDSMGVPVIMCNAMEYSPNDSWKGTPLTSILDNLFAEACRLYGRLHEHMPQNLEEHEELCRMASHGIVLMDEFDKIRIRHDSTNGFSRDYQASLLKIVEGAEYQLGEAMIHVSGDEDEPGMKDVPICINTSEVMFIFLGAFEGLSEITRNRLLKEKNREAENGMHQAEGTNRIGFMVGAEPERKEEVPDDAALTPSLEDIIEYGIIRELAGRIALRTVYKPLSVENLVKILKESKTSAFLDYQARFRAMGHSLVCDESGFREIAHIASRRKTGARGLSSILSELLMPSMYELSGRKEPMECVLRGDDIKNGKPPVLKKMKVKRLSNGTRYNA